MMLVGLHNKMGKQGAYSAAELWWIPRPFTQRVEEVPIIEVLTHIGERLAIPGSN